MQSRLQNIMRIAVMQPYFIPYAGYFRLFAASDLFVIYDDVQFPKEGWVNRNQLTDASGQSVWLTLPLRKASLSTQIREMQFADHAQEKWQRALQRFPLLHTEAALQHPLRQRIDTLDGTFIDFLTENLKLTCEALGLHDNVIHSSDIAYNRELKGSERLLDLLGQLDCTHYINAPGGQSLYQPEDFRQRGITLAFLPDYGGAKQSILQRLLEEGGPAVRHEIDQYTTV